MMIKVYVPLVSVGRTTFRLSGLHQARRSNVLHRLMDQEAIILLFDGIGGHLSLLASLGLVN